MSKQLKGVGVWLIVLVLMIAGLSYLGEKLQTQNNYSYKELEEDLENHRVAEAVIHQNQQTPTGQLIAVLMNGRSKDMYIDDVKEVRQMLEDANVSYQMTDVPKESKLLSVGVPIASLGVMVILLFTAGIYFTLRTRLLPVRLFRDMIAAVCEKNQSRDSLSSFQTLIVSTATRVGMGNLVGVVAAVSAGGAGAVFWMWVTALLGASTSFVESTLAQKYRQPDPLYGGQRGGPAYYIHVLAERRRGKKLRHSIIAVLFAISGLICWCGISQVISNSVSSAFANAFSIPPIVTTVVLVVLSAVIVLRKDATVKSLDVIVPIMAVCYFVMTVIIIAVNFRQLPAVLGRIFSEAFGLRQVAAGGFGAVLMNGVKRGLFSNEAGSGSAPCAAAAASCDDPVKMGFVQALGVLIDTVVICSCTAFMMLLAPANVTTGLTGMDLLQAAAQYHLGSFGVVFIAVTLALFSFSTFIGILFYARSNVAYLFGDRWGWQTAYKVLALVMLMVGGLEAYTVVWDLGDVGIGLMTIFNLIALYPMSGEAIAALRDYECRKHLTQN